MRPAVTVLLGSGFSEGLGLAGTHALTDVVKSTQGPVVFAGGTSIPIADNLWRMAANYYDHLNFEIILHVVEAVMMYPAFRDWLTTDDKHKSAFGAFMQVEDRWRTFIEQGTGSAFLDYENSPFLDYYGRAIQEICDKLISGIGKITDDDARSVSRLLSALLNRFALVIATLNYDDVAERALDHWEDGFAEKPGGLFGFEPLRMLRPIEDAPFILHLHGSIRFYLISEDRTQMFRAADGTLRGSQSRRPQMGIAQSGERILVGPMISGLRKTDKVTVPPFGYYQYKLHDAILRSPRLLVIGYGAGDLYLNRLLVEMKRAHGDALRLAFITKGTSLLDIAEKLHIPAIAMDIGQEGDDFNALAQSVFEASATRTVVHDRNVLIYSAGFPFSDEITEGIVEFLVS